ncbi:MAG: peptidoglycan DD-metalloendopeptidase family protein [Anaerolineales bacterium]|nr:peptidoglycan DD-metalloendopeptidase family protein [Anaerolineales bacterium]
MAFTVLALALGTSTFFEAQGAMLIEVQKTDFILPFADPPGPDSWYFLQPYGNTTFAYQFRTTTYGSGQGMHFGIDLAAPCGTPILAIGDGTVYSVDSWHGARPHNLMINHDNGYASFYGHLLMRSPMKRGEKVMQGQVVGQVGDPDLTCSSRPHLHLEIRSENHREAYNPLTLIEADWEHLALIGGHPQSFEQDMDIPRRWQGLLDQPNVKFGYPLLNAYDSAYPPDW